MSEQGRDILEAIAELRLAVTAEIAGTEQILRRDVLGEIAAFRVAVMEKFDRVEARFGQFHDDIHVTTSMAGIRRKTAQIAREDIEALAEPVGILLRKQQKLEARFDELTNKPL